LCGSKARLPRVSFYSGMRLRRGDEVGEVLGCVPATPLISVAWPSAGEMLDAPALLAAIARGHVTIEPTVGMRVETGPFVCKVTSADALYVVVDYGNACPSVMRYSLAFFYEQIRTGTWAVLPPEQDTAKQVDVIDGMRLRQKDGVVWTVQRHVGHDRVTIDGINYSREHISRMIEAGTLTVEPETPAFELETDPRILELEAARVERGQRIAELERKVAMVEAREAKCLAEVDELRKACAMWVAQNEARQEALDAAQSRIRGLEVSLVAAEVRATNAESRAAGAWSGACAQLDGAAAKFQAERDAAMARTYAAERKLADVMAHGLDSLPAMYPIRSLATSGERGSVVIFNYGDGTWSSADGPRGTFREALHAAVVAGGGKLPDVEATRPTDLRQSDVAFWNEAIGRALEMTDYGHRTEPHPHLLDAVRAAHDAARRVGT
jgi:hypothetical protein